jgi:PTS system nitrogen regulatory IIA component
MNIGELITAERIQAKASIRSKKHALEHLSQMLSGGTTQLTEDEILAALVNREKLGTTGMGGGVAIPHGRMGGLTHSVVAFLQLSDGIDFEASDGTPVDLIFALLVPEQTTEEHLKTLAALAEMLSEDDFCDRLRATGDAEALLDLLSSFSPAQAE